MSKFDLFESIKTGLEQAIEYEKGNPANVRVRKIKIEPVHQFGAQEIRDIRKNANLSQSAFASFMGVSKKDG